MLFHFNSFFHTAITQIVEILPGVSQGPPHRLRLTL